MEKGRRCRRDRTLSSDLLKVIIEHGGGAEGAALRERYRERKS